MLTRAMENTFVFRLKLKLSLAKLILPMGNILGVYESMYGVKKAKRFFLIEILHASELARIPLFHCTVHEVDNKASLPIIIS